MTEHAVLSLCAQHHCRRDFGESPEALGTGAFGENEE